MSGTVVDGTVTVATAALGAAVAGGFGAGLADGRAGAGGGAGAPRYWPELGSIIRDDSSTASKALAGTRLRSEMKPSSQLLMASPWKYQLEPSTQGWYEGDRSVTCVAEPKGDKEGNVMVGSVRKGA